MLTEAEVVLQVLINGVSAGLLYVLIALGLTMVFGIMGIINFAHGEFYMLGAYTMFYLYSKLAINFFVALILVMILLAPVGVLVERIFYRRLRGQPMSVLIVAIGLSLFIVSGGYVAFGIQDRVITSPFQGLLRFGGSVISLERVATIVIGLVLVTGVYLLVSKTKIGRAMRAVEQDHEAAALVGVSINQTYGICMAVGTGLAGVAGALLGMLTVINPSMGGAALFKAFIIMIIGGLGSLPGAIVGGILLGVVESFATTFIAPEIAPMIAFLLIIVLLIFKPEGLIGRG